MSSPIYQCAVNFSEGRRAWVIEALANAIQTAPKARLIDYSADYDHNRCVMTLLGDETALEQALLAAAEVAIAHIDLRDHQGVHPRTGAIDVLPVTPLRHANRESAAALAHALGNHIATKCKIPVYFYEWAAKQGRPHALPQLRKGGFEAFALRKLTSDIAPDAGPSNAHPSAGILIVGARAPLVAYNINLHSADLACARRIARRIREERETRAELSGVRALGLWLESQKRAQISMNLTRPHETPLPALFTHIQEIALLEGAGVFESEVIGAIPLASLDGKPPETILWRQYRPTQILETWLPSATP